MATIKEIKALLSKIENLDSVKFDELAKDKRQGVLAAVVTRKRELSRQKEEAMRLDKMLTFERQLYANGRALIAGIDEVGRGPLAGPVVAAAVILPKNCKIAKLNDSKQIPKHYHAEVYDSVLAAALSIGVGIVFPGRIDEINIYEATKEAMLMAVAELSLDPDHLLIDAMTLDLPIEQTALIKGDAKSLSIAAASIVAKVTRDRLMAEYAFTYPQYGFEQNAGYGTAQHLDALKTSGITPIHRKSFEPIKSMLAREK